MSPVIALPSGVVRPRLSLRTLVKTTPVSVKKRGIETSVRVSKVGFGADFKYIQAGALHDTIVHQCMIVLYDAQKAGHELWSAPAWVGCDCEHFTFTCEVALHKFGCTDIRLSNGEFPVIKNPRMIPQLCKHLTALSPYAVEHVTNRKKSRPEMPAMRGPIPKALRNAIDSQMLPTTREIGEALQGVRDFY